MSSLGGGGHLDPEPSVRQIQTAGYLNKQLSEICAAESLNKAGVKAELQNRIIERIRHYARNRDSANFERLRRIITESHTVGFRPGVAVPSSSAVYAANSYLSATNHRVNSHNMGGNVNGYRGSSSQKLEFKPSPFYSFEQQLGDVQICDVMQHHRHTVKFLIKVAEHPILARVVRDPSLRVMIFSAGDNQGRQNIAFPHQSEIKVNSGEVKANLRGLKNKPGSTRPVDITKELRLNLPAYENNVDMTYALTTKAGEVVLQRFYLAIWVVKIIPVGVLVQKIEGGKRITEKLVLDEMVSKARDPDIQTTASVLSLKCPLSTLRIDLPCRSISCRHNQCFDATSYLQLQEQGPTWLCPICNNAANFESLAVDEYVKDILSKTPRSADQVTVQPDGKWGLHTKMESEVPSKNNMFPSSDSDDELVEITKSGDNVRTSTPQILKRPIFSSAQPREASSSSLPREQGSTSGKRPIAAVIDLTSSGDEDDEPIARPPKRQQTNTNGYGTPSNIPVFRPGPANGYSSY